MTDQPFGQRHHDCNTDDDFVFKYGRWQETTLGGGGGYDELKGTSLKLKGGKGSLAINQGASGIILSLRWEGGLGALASRREQGATGLELEERGREGTAC